MKDMFLLQFFLNSVPLKDSHIHLFAVLMGLTHTQKGTSGNINLLPSKKLFLPI